MQENGEGRKPIRVFLVDDHPSVLNGLKASLEEPDFEIAGIARTGKEAISGILASEPDVVILDVRLPDLSGLDVLRRVKAGAPGVAVIMFTAFPEPGYLLDAVSGGAGGFLLKDSEGSQVADVVRRIDEGDNALAPEVWKPMLREFQARQLARRGAQAEGWDGTDLAILNCMALGQANAVIAATLDMPYDTIRSRNKRIFARLRTSDRTQAVVKAIGLGLLTPSDQEE